LGLSKRADARNKEKEGVWRKTLKEWQESNKSQAEFCREKGLNTNTFSGWKRIIPERDAQARKSGKARRSALPDSGQIAGREPSPAFVRVAMPECRQNNDISADALLLTESTLSGPAIAAELLDASTGRRMRIFNGADQPTVAALLSAFAAV
jgi:hypothetical protein